MRRIPGRTGVSAPDEAHLRPNGAHFGWDEAYFSEEAYSGLKGAYAVPEGAHFRPNEVYFGWDKAYFSE